ncbi:hypothetical protein BWQ96_06215 [Gracilariopsis chorda]|uniref:Uncharacterized protein n=1 Tax=Gracilariopsis chorda TaxID=448386 RepID=A0A2V3IPP2_9FLOR|nr:hypothetical protein BWQ96_06215 [Gracilariopsis chorda]|eukprot:PXF44042.1 hypothetical protein BWQ96_06215 [Gracilariopsis chorda]
MQSLTKKQLFSITQRAPATIRKDLSPLSSNEELLAHTFRLHDVEMAAQQDASALSAAASLITLMDMPKYDILKM